MKYAQPGNGGEANVDNDFLHATKVTTEKNEDAVKPVLNGHSKEDQKLAFKTNYCLMQVKSIAECILQHFRPSFTL